MTPFDVGAYASSHDLYFGNGRYQSASEQVADQIRERAALMLELEQSHGTIFAWKINTPSLPMAAVL